MSDSFSFMEAPVETGAREGVTSACALYRAAFFFLLRWERVRGLFVDEFGPEEDAEETQGAASVADFSEIVAGSAIVNNDRQVQNASPRPCGIRSQEGPPSTVPGGGLGNNGGPEIFLAEVGGIGWPPWWSFMVCVVCVRVGGKVDGEMELRWSALRPT